MIKEQHKKHEKFVGRDFFSSLFICKNKKEVVQKDEKGRKGAVEVESVNNKKFRR